MSLIYLAQEKDTWQALVATALNNVFMKGEFLDWLSTYGLLTKDSAL
jgi:hypothetical protein